MPVTLYRYLVKEILTAFFLGFIVFTGVLLMGRMLNLADMVVSKGVPVSHLLLMIAYLLPNFSVLTIPMSLLLAVLLAFSRLSGDSELTAIKASGTSLYTLLPPILLIAAAAYGLTTLTTIYALPKANAAFKELLYSTVRGKLNLNLKERVFDATIPGVLIYASDADKGRNLFSGVMIHDERNPNDVSTIFARTGSMEADEKSNKLRIYLNDGVIHQPRPKGVYRHLNFSAYDLVIDTSKEGSSFKRSETDMTLTEMRDYLKNGGISKKLLSDIRFEIHKRLAMPFACFIFAILAVPLGIQNRRSGKASGFSFSIAMLLLYYILQVFGKGLGEKNLLSPFMAVWMPNFIFLAAGIYLFVRSANEEQGALFDRISRAISFLSRRKRVS